MSKSEARHELYLICKDIDLEEADEIIGVNTTDNDEKDFIRKVTDFILQQKQKKVIAEKRL